MRITITRTISRSLPGVRSPFEDRKEERRGEDRRTEDRRSEDRHNKVVNIHATTS